MSNRNHFAAPSAPVAAVESPEDIANRQSQANMTLNLARLGFVVFFSGFVALGYVTPNWAGAILLSMLAAFVLAHALLGFAAARAGKSWLVYGLLPLLVPVLGGLVSFAVLRQKVPHAAA